MKKLFLLTKTLLAVALLCVGQNAWGDVLETVGSTDCTSGWWTVFSTGNYGVSRGEGRHIRFINHNSGESTTNWWNWILGLNSQQDRSGTEFCVIRSDNYGWDSNIMNYYCNYNWTDYNTKMNGATVDMYIYYKGTNVFINNLITTNEPTPSTWTYNISLYNINVDEVFPFFVADHSYIDVTLSEKVEIPNTIPDYSTIGCKTWQVWTEATNTRTINSGESYHFRFKNYYIGSNAWENFLIKGHQLTKNPSTEAYDIVTDKFAMRADHYDDITTGQCTNNFGSADLSQVYANGATVDAVVTYNANNTATVRADITTADGTAKYYEEETITLEEDGLPLYIKPAVNGAYLEMMQESATYTVAASSANLTMGTANVTSGASEGVAKAGASVTVTATPNDGYRFVNWTENDVEISTNASYTYTALDNRSLVANFEPTTVSATIGSYEYATFSSTYPVNVDVTGLEAYIATGENGDYITMQKVTGDVAANTGLVLKGAANTYSLPVVASGTTYNTESDPKNYLFAISSNYNLNKSNTGTNYVLTVQNTKVVWAPINGKSAAVTAGHSALWLPASGSSLARAMRFSGDITGVANVEATAEAKAQDGKFIENGKLVIVKNGVKYNAAGAKLY